MSTAPVQAQDGAAVALLEAERGGSMCFIVCESCLLGERLKELCTFVFAETRVSPRLSRRLNVFASVEELTKALL